MLTENEVLRDKKECSLRIFPDLIPIVGIFTYSRRAAEVLGRLYENPKDQPYKEHEKDIVNRSILPRAMMLGMYNAIPFIWGLDALLGNFFK